MGAVTATTPDERTVVLSLTVSLGRDDAYRAFTDEELLRRWFWPDRLAPEVHVDPRVGGMLRVVSEVIGVGCTATFRELEPDRRLAADWTWDGDPVVTSVVAEFADGPEGALITVTHGDNPSEETRENHRTGWLDCLERLDRLRL